MKKVLFSSILALSLLALTGCYESATCANSAIKTTKSKCGTGKCGDSKTMKCGAGKCGDAKKAETTKKCGADGKCGTGKCGTAK